MKTKEYLRKLKKLDTVINQKIEELNSLRIMSDSIRSVDYSKEKVQTNHTNEAPFITTIERMSDLEKEINTEIDTYVIEKHKIINQIQGLSNHLHIQVLYKLYVEFKQLEEVADELGYSYQYIRSLHGSALKEFETSYKILY